MLGENWILELVLISFWTFLIMIVFYAMIRYIRVERSNSDEKEQCESSPPTYTWRYEKKTTYGNPKKEAKS